MSSIEHCLPNLVAIHHSDKFILTMSSLDKFVLRKLANNVFDSFKIRKHVEKGIDLFMFGCIHFIHIFNSHCINV